MHMGRGAWAPILSVLLHQIDGRQAGLNPGQQQTWLCELWQVTLPSPSLINSICKNEANNRSSHLLKLL